MFKDGSTCDFLSFSRNVPNAKHFQWNGQKMSISFSLSLSFFHCPLFISSPAGSRQRCSSSRPAGRLWDPGPSEDPPQPGDPVRLPGQVRGGCAPLQTGPGGPGEDLWTRPPRRGHYAQHPGPRLQVSPVQSSLTASCPPSKMILRFMLLMKLSYL